MSPVALQVNFQEVCCGLPVPDVTLMETLPFSHSPSHGSSHQSHYLCQMLRKWTHFHFASSYLPCCRELLNVRHLGWWTIPNSCGEVATATSEAFRRYIPACLSAKEPFITSGAVIFNHTIPTWPSTCTCPPALERQHQRRSTVAQGERRALH